MQGVNLKRRASLGLTAGVGKEGKTGRRIHQGGQRQTVGNTVERNKDRKRLTHVLPGWISRIRLLDLDISKARRNAPNKVNEDGDQENNQEVARVEKDP